MNEDVRCPACGARTQRGQRFCANCGIQLEETPPELDREDAPVAAQPPGGPAGRPRTDAPAPPATTAKRGWWRSLLRAKRTVIVAVPVVAVVGAGVAIALVTSPSSDEAANTVASTATVDTQAVEQRREALAKYNKCKATTQPLMDRLHELDSRLSVGLNYDEYTTKVGDVRVAYDKVTAEIRGQAECLANVGIPAEAAFNQYVKASNLWSDCFDDINCSNDQIKPSLQSHWEKAGRAIAQADSGLEDVKKPAGS